MFVSWNDREVVKIAERSAMFPVGVEYESPDASRVMPCELVFQRSATGMNRLTFELEHRISWLRQTDVLACQMRLEDPGVGTMSAFCLLDARRSTANSSHRRS